MELEEDWTLVDVPDMDELPGPVFQRIETLPASHIFPPH